MALQLYRVTMHRNGGFARLPRSFLVSILVAAAAAVHGITAMTLLEAEMMIRNPLGRRRSSSSKVSIQM